MNFSSSRGSTWSNDWLQKIDFDMSGSGAEVKLGLRPISTNLSKIIISCFMALLVLTFALQHRLPSSKAILTDDDCGAQKQNQRLPTLYSAPVFQVMVRSSKFTKVKKSAQPTLEAATNLDRLKLEK
jgi:hypothetical protein